MDQYVCKCGNDKWEIGFGGITCTECHQCYEIRVMSPARFEQNKKAFERN